MAFNWSKELELGNPQLDAEHQELLKQINDFMTACSQGKGRSEILRTLHFLKHYIITHLDHEEELQKKSGYPDLLNHKLFHKKFIDEVNRLEKQYTEQGDSLLMVNDINQHLGSWFVTHIKTEDVKLAAYLKDNPVT